MYSSERIMMAFGGISDRKIENTARALGYCSIQYPKQRTTIRTHKVLIIAATLALILALGITAYALGAHSEFFHNVFGTGVSGQEAKTVNITDSNGNTVKTENYPSQERVEADEEQAELLIGEYVSAVNQSVRIGDYKFTVRDVVFDASGNGAVTVDLDNSNGHGLKADGSFEGDAVPFTWSGYSVWSTGGTPIASRDYVISEGYSNTHITFVYSITAGALASDEGIILRFGVYSKDDSREEAEIIIPAAERIPAHEYYTDGLKVMLSPVGMALSFDNMRNDEEYIINEVTISYTDGNCYRVADENEANYMNAAGGGENIHLTFNRIVDTDSIDSISVVITHIGDQRTSEETYSILT